VNYNASVPELPEKPVAHFELVITSRTIAPDNFPQESYLINGQFPGPLIRLKHNSIVSVTVRNQLRNNSITIHFHGIHQRGSFLSDGVPGVTQEPIQPGASITQIFDTWPQSGTFFYHAHTGMDITSLYGPLIIEDDPVVYNTWPASYQYDAEKVLILNGIYHESLDSLVERIVGPVHNYPQSVDSLTVNGKSYGEWENVTSPKRSSSYEVVSVKKGLRYRFRFINAASDSLLVCNISGHSFSVIEMDGIYTHPVQTDYILISPGQRYSVIIDMDQEEGNHLISCKHAESPGPKNGLAVLSYNGGSYPSKKLRRLDMGIEKDNVELDKWIVDDLSPNYKLKQTDVYDVPPNVDKEFLIDVFEAINGTRHVYLINGHRYKEPEIPYYLQLGQRKNISDPPQVFEVKKGEVVQFVFQNRVTGRCFSHPWHIHGHTFYVVAEGPDEYDPVKDGEAIREKTKAGNTNRFRFRDSVTVFANQTTGSNTADGAPCGWSVVRFIVNNPGLWLAHCHVTPHMIMGKKFVIWEHSEEDPYLSSLMEGSNF
jgi:L-ascorbate oxidase